MLAIVGPTGVGKTELALKLADRLPVEIISSDSRQVYRYMDIGTAKPTPDQLASVPHHLISIVDPDYAFNLGDFCSRAGSAIRSINRSRRLPVLVGGTGQYVMSVLEGWNVPRIPPDPTLRRQLEEELRTGGLKALLDRLSKINANQNIKIDLRNPRRVIRAIELASADQPTDSRPRRQAPDFRALVIGLTSDRPQLYKRTDDRVDRMIQAGLLREVEWLLASGYCPELPSMSSIGYRELADHLMGGTDLDLAVSNIKYRTHRYVRQQSSWFRKTDPRIRWFDTSRVDLALETAVRWAGDTDTA